MPGRVTHIRPGLIVGPGDPTDRFTYWPVRVARGGEVLAPGDGADPVQFIDARDLAEWTIRMAEARAFGVFNATGPAGALTMKAMLATIAATTKSDARFTWVPAPFLDAHQVSAWSDLPVWVPGQGDTAGFARRDIGRALVKIAGIIDDARAAQVQLLVLPDATLGGYLSDLRHPDPLSIPPALAEDSREVSRIRALAGAMVVCFGYAEAVTAA